MRTTQSNYKKARPRVYRGCGNVFSDLGFAPNNAAELQVKAELGRQIYHRIKALGLTLVEAAERLRVTHADAFSLMSARFTGFSIDRLTALLNAL